MKRPVYMTNGSSTDWEMVAKQLGYVPLTERFTEGKKKTVHKERFQTELIDVEVEQFDHEH